MASIADTYQDFLDTTTPRTPSERLAGAPLRLVQPCCLCVDPSRSCGCPKNERQSLLASENGGCGAHSIRIEERYGTRNSHFVFRMLGKSTHKRRKVLQKYIIRMAIREALVYHSGGEQHGGVPGTPVQREHTTRVTGQLFRWRVRTS